MVLLQTDALERLHKEHNHQAQLNSKVKSDAAAAQERADTLAREKTDLQRKAALLLSFPLDGAPLWTA